MKKPVLLLITFVACLTIQSCKYEEGPALSCRSKTARVANLWRLSELYVNDTLQDLTQGGGYTLQLTTDGIAITTLDNALIMPITGTWTFGDKKETIEILYPSDTTNPDNVPAVYGILKLKNDEMWLERKEDNGVTVNRIESHFITDPSAE